MLNMTDYGIALICLMIVIVAILISSLVKVIMQKVVQDNGSELDCSKWEYLFAAISLFLSAIGVFCFLKFFVGVTDANELIKSTTLYAGSTQAVYLFIVQLIRKGGKGIINALKNLFEKLKQSKNPVKELPEIIKEEIYSQTVSNVDIVNTGTISTNTNKALSDVDNLKNDFAKIIAQKSINK